jgi:hypothetical protein
MEELKEKKVFGKEGTMYHDGIPGFFYVLSIIGAAVYFIQHSTTFWTGVLGLLKAFVWPVFVVYKALELLKL